MTAALNVRAGQTQRHVWPQQRAFGAQAEGHGRAQHGQHVLPREGRGFFCRALQIDGQFQIQRAIGPVMAGALPLSLPRGAQTARRQLQAGQRQTRRSGGPALRRKHAAFQGKIQPGF